MSTRTSTSIGPIFAIATATVTLGLGATMFVVGESNGGGGADVEPIPSSTGADATRPDASVPGASRRDGVVPGAPNVETQRPDPDDPSTPHDEALGGPPATAPDATDASHDEPLTDPLTDAHTDAHTDPAIDGDADESAEDERFGAEGEPVVETVGTFPAGDDPTPGFEPFQLIAVTGHSSPSPCDVAAANGQMLVVSPEALQLPSTSNTADVAVTWCGGSPTTLSPVAGVGAWWNVKGLTTVQPESTVDMSVTVDRDAFPIGAFSTEATIAAADGSTGSVVVDGMAFGPFGAGSGSASYTAGASAPGCSTACISSAQLVPGSSATDVGLDVATTVPATFELYVLGHAPMFFLGEPMLAGATAVGATAVEGTSWSTGLGDLAADTTVHLVLGATDEQDRTQWVTHSFTTLAAPSQYTGNDPDPGCAAACIVEASLAPGQSHDAVTLHIETHTPAKITAQVGTSLTWSDGQPILTDTHTDATFHEFETSWDASFDGLDGDTTYHVVVRATDHDGNTDIRTGEFGTAEAPPTGVVVRFEKLLVRWDADSSTVNRGELRFAWGVDDIRLATRGEAKHHTGDQITLETAGPGWFVPFDDDQPRLLTLAGGERDPSVGQPPCPATSGENVDGVPDWRQQDRHDCDNVKWNTAPMLMTLDEIAELPWCAEYGIEGPAGNRKCHDVDTPDFGPDVPRFASVVSFEILG